MKCVLASDPCRDLRFSHIRSDGHACSQWPFPSPGDSTTLFLFVFRLLRTRRISFVLVFTYTRVYRFAEAVSAVCCRVVNINRNASDVPVKLSAVMPLPWGKIMRGEPRARNVH